MRQPIAPMTARNGSPPTHDAAATPPNRMARTAAMPARPMRSRSGRRSRGAVASRSRRWRGRRTAGRRGDRASSVGSRSPGVVGHRVDSRYCVIRSPAIGAATSPPRPPCSTITAMAISRRLGRGEADEPGVRLARAAELGRAGLAGGRHAGDLGPGGEALAEVALDGLGHRLGDGVGIGAVDDAGASSSARSSRVPSLAGDAPSRGVAA